MSTDLYKTYPCLRIMLRISLIYRFSKEIYIVLQNIRMKITGSIAKAISRYLYNHRPAPIDSNKNDENDSYQQYLLNI